MHENTRMLILSGVHGNIDGKLGDREDKFVSSCEAQVKNLRRNKSEDIEVKNIEFKVEDVGQIDINDHNKRELDEDKFVEAVKAFKPTVLVLAFCWSHKSELNDLLRAAGVYGTLILREDLAQITESRQVQLDEGQEELIRRIAEEKPKNVFLWGSSGTGKTLMLCEALKIKISQLRRSGKKDVRVFVTTMKGDQPLLKDIEEKYLSDINVEGIMRLGDLARKINIQHVDLSEKLNARDGFVQAKSLLKTIISHLGGTSHLPPRRYLQADQSSASHTILLVDEVQPMTRNERDLKFELGSTKADWSSFTSREGVDFIIALSATNYNNKNTKYKVVPPTDSRTLSKRLTTPHRNCKEIETFFKYYVHHHGSDYLSGIEKEKEAEYLPPGRMPIWVQRGREVSDEEVLEFVKENYVD